MYVCRYYRAAADVKATAAKEHFSSPLIAIKMAQWANRKVNNELNKEFLLHCKKDNLYNVASFG